eukprot:18873_1
MDMMKLSSTSLSISDFSSNDLSVSDLSSSESDTDFIQLIQNLSTCEEELLFQKKGFKNMKKIRDISQGELISATYIDTAETDTQISVQIKKIDKLCNQNHTTFTDEYNMNYVIDDDIIKEEKILNHLTNQNTPINDCINKVITFFESDTHYYLVTELATNPIQSQMTLKQFTTQALEHVQNGKLSRREYHKIIKQIFYQLSTVINWLHNHMNCCHLNLSIKNIVLKNAQFITQQDQSVHISTNITIQLTDFSKADIFKNDNFDCLKSNYVHLSEYGPHYFNPNRLQEELFDARGSDMWALGMILYECFVQEPIYTFKDINLEGSNMYSPYWAVMSNNLYQYICMHALSKYFSTKIFEIISQLLQINENKRLNSKDLFHCKWFNSDVTLIQK